MSPNDELNLNKISKDLANNYTSIKFKNKTPASVMQETAWHAERCVRMAGLNSDDKSTWASWIADAMHWMLMGAGLIGLDIGAMMTKEENSHGMD